MPIIADLLPGLFPGFAGPAPSVGGKVWRESTPYPVRFKPVPKAAAWRTWRKAVDFDRKTKAGGGKHGGAIGHAALRVLHALLFDFRDYRTGRLDPSYAAIAAKANVCIRTVYNCIHRLKEKGILSWERRCSIKERNGRKVIDQDTNAYEVHDESDWKGYAATPKPQPSPGPDSWGQPSRVPDVIEAAALEPTMGAAIRALETAPPGTLEAALASLGRRIAEREEREASNTKPASDQAECKKRERCPRGI